MLMGDSSPKRLNTEGLGLGSGIRGGSAQEKEEWPQTSGLQVTVQTGTHVQRGLLMEVVAAFP